MNEKDAPLEDLRREIDDIDNATHDLVMRRFALTERVLAAKAGAAGAVSLGAALRPGREAQILRRLMNRHEGRPSPLVIAHIWREIVSASLMAQSLFSVEVFGGDNLLAIWDLARNHFGGAARMRQRASAKEVLRALADGECAFAVLPAPEASEAEPWWPLLSTLNEGAPRIAARLPFVGPSDGPQALVVAPIKVDESGDDVSVFTLLTDGDVSRARLSDWLGKAAPRGVWHASVKVGESGDLLHLVAFDGWVASGDAIFASLSGMSGGAIRQITSIGGYARPVEMAVPPRREN